MTETRRSDLAANEADLSEHDRDARVEELLLTGLDHYFCGQPEQAINVWTRVLFLDRGHARARAYIERARSAVSERQREGEELIHTGIAAFQRGDAGAARELLTSAVERGAHTDEAMALLDRLDRLETAGGQPDQRAVPEAVESRPRLHPHESSEVRRTRLRWVAAGALCGIVAATALLVFAWSRGADWLPLSPAPVTATAPPALDEPVPLPPAAEVWLARGRTLYAKGRLREALNALAGIRPGDPLQGQADALRVEIQRQLLAAARGRGAAATAPGGTGDRR
jgi:tetratricopeptide (TPR) repeat protein